MKKIVNESVHEFRANRKPLNEGIWDKAYDTIRGLISKIGKFFYVMINGEPASAMPPVNIGVMDKMGALPPAIAYLPSNDDLELEPGLSSLTAERIIAKRGPDEVNESALMEERVTLTHPDKKIMNIDKRSLIRRIRMSWNNPKTVLMVWGAPGVGKTQIIRTVLDSVTGGKAKLIDVQTSKMAPDDWALPAIYNHPAKGQQAVDIPKSWLPVYVPTGDKEVDAQLDNDVNGAVGGIIFLDELSRAAESVQNSCLKLVNERVIGNAVLGSKWIIIAASNRTIDDPDTLPLWGKALGNRFSQVNYVPDFKSWKEWAVGPGKIDQRIIDFLEFNPEFFYTLDDQSDIFASPRSWEYASIDLAALMQDALDTGERIRPNEIIEVVGSNVGGDIATQLATFIRLLESIKKEDIHKILNDPMKAPLPRKSGSGYDPSEAHALLSVIISSTRPSKFNSDGSIPESEWLDPKKVDNLVTYLIRLDNPSLATRAIKMLFEVHPYMHEELADIDGRDKYAAAIDKFTDKYKDIL